MPLGDYLAGEGLAGSDPVQTSVRRTYAPPAALDFDNIKKDFVLDLNGNYRDVHPVDAEVFLAVRVAQKSIKSAVDIGNTLKEITHIDRRTFATEAENRLRLALARLLDSGAISIYEIRVDLSVLGRPHILLDYFNNLLPGRPRKQAQV